EAGKGAEVLVPVGANSFLVAASKDVDRAFVSIGSDLLVYDDIKQQIERLDGRIKSITDAANAIGQRLVELQRRAEAQGAAVQDLYDRLQAKGAPSERNEMFKSLRERLAGWKEEAEADVTSGAIGDAGKKIKEDKLEEVLYDLEIALLESDVAFPVAKEIVDRLADDLKGKR